MTYLLIIILFLAILQPAGNQRAASVIFAVSILAFDVFCGDMSGDDYFLADSLNSATCFILLRKFDPKPFVAYALQCFCAASITLNVAGYALYISSMSGTLYVMAFQVFHLMIILFLFHGGPLYGHFKGDRKFCWFNISNDLGDNLPIKARL